MYIYNVPRRMNKKLAHEGNTMRITAEKISEEEENPFTSS
jgi:hypothetical protein